MSKELTMRNGEVVDGERSTECDTDDEQPTTDDSEEGTDGAA